MGFRNPLVAGVQLVRSAIQSANYVPSTSGWRISRNGLAVFQQLTILDFIYSLTNILGYIETQTIRFINSVGPTISAGTDLPATCAVGSLFLKTVTNPGLYICRVANQWIGPSGTVIKRTYTPVYLKTYSVTFSITGVGLFANNTIAHGFTTATNMVIFGTLTMAQGGTSQNTYASVSLRQNGTAIYSEVRCLTYVATETVTVQMLAFNDTP